MGDFTRVKSPMKIHGRFYLSKKTPDYKMTHQLFTLFWIISNILTFHFYTFSVIYTFYFYIAFEELTIYKKCSIKSDLYSLFYIKEGCLNYWLKLKKLCAWSAKPQTRDVQHSNGSIPGLKKALPDNITFDNISKILWSMMINYDIVDGQLL